ncbi:hypothetical protein FRC20_006118 [Serendipita sp. 405]|nr:hypothetical protein FRC15_006112 [Serendipita sp. 397]KAG8769733.1 hypothetical protein FRC16_006586 [Serendipita sp. 398]KAG8839113.1 hypothetical protein FRC20_006118 [Serendipita sp. 405]
MPRGPNDYIFFWKPEEEYGWASQWYESPFWDKPHQTSKYLHQTNGPSTGLVVFPTAEHYMMYQKAILFHDYTVADQILETPATNPARVKHLGKQVHGFNEHVWNEKRWEIVKNGSRLKFEQNPELKRVLLETGRDMALVEASPYDRIWGIGKTKEDALKSLNETDQWGLNLLGRILEEIRTELREKDAAMPRGPNDYIFFWKTSEEYGWASQWYESPFFDKPHPTSEYFDENESGGGLVLFPTAEHYMMYQKAILFQDYPIADQILETPVSDPGRVKRLGKQVKGFNEQVWNENRWEIVKNGNRLKFEQNPELKRVLVETGRDIALVEASPYDRIWGIGKTKEDALKSLNETDQWGLNLLGRILEEVRTELREKDATTAAATNSGSHL